MIYIPPEKRQQIVDALRSLYNIKMEHQKISNLLVNKPDIVPKCIAKKWIEVHDQSGNEIIDTNK